MDQYAEGKDSAEATLKKINAQKLFNSVFMYHVSTNLEF